VSRGETPDRADRRGPHAMIKWAIIFFVISVIAGFFGFTGVASGARTIAKVLFFIALIVFLIVLVFGVMLGKLIF
jgi:uncharacterized membrane protein YtjA (UPF0391 family)